MPASASASAPGPSVDRGGITRRSFLMGAAAAVAAPAAIAAATSLSGCKKKSSETIDTLMVDDSQIMNLADFTEVASDGMYYLQASLQMPVGSMVWMAGDLIAVALIPGETATPLSHVDFIDLSTLEEETALSQAVSSAEGYEIYEVRSSLAVCAWVEYNYMTFDWRLYAAQYQGLGSLGTPVQLDEGDINYDPPLFTVTGSNVVWQLLPYEDGAYSSGESYLKSQMLTAADATTLYTSYGRLIATPESDDGIVSVVPRVDTSGVYYDMVALNPASGETYSSVILPKSVKVTNAIYMDSAWSFCVEASYDSDSAIAQVGTYRDIGNGRYLRCSKSPMCTPMMCDGYFIFKYVKSTAVVDVAGGTWFKIPAPDNSWDYGDFLATSGDSSYIVTYATVDPNKDVNSAYVQVNAYGLNQSAS